jgi:hypothetical protein
MKIQRARQIPDVILIFPMNEVLVHITQVLARELEFLEQNDSFTGEVGNICQRPCKRHLKASRLTTTTTVQYSRVADFVTTPKERHKWQTKCRPVSCYRSSIPKRTADPGSRAFERFNRPIYYLIICNRSFSVNLSHFLTTVSFTCLVSLL